MTLAPSLLALVPRWDADDPIHGALVTKLDALAARFDRVVVAADEARAGQPGASNVEVHAIGKASDSAMGRADRLAAVLRSAAGGPGPVLLLGMTGPSDLVLAAPLARARGMRTMLWHPSGRRSPSVAGAAAVADLVLVPTPADPVGSAAVEVVGYGIDVSSVSLAPVKRDGPLRLVSFGPWPAGAGHERAIRAMARACQLGHEVILHVAGTRGGRADHEQRTELERLARLLGVGMAVRFDTVATRAAHLEAIGATDAVLALGDADFLEPAVEAMAAGRPVVTDAPELAGLVAPATGVDLHPEPGDLEAAARSIGQLAELPALDLAWAGQQLQVEVQAVHTVEQWAQRVLHLAEVAT